MKRKRIMSTLLALGLVTMVGCSQEEASSTSTNSAVTSTQGQEAVELTLWHYYNGNTNDMLNSIIQEFNTSYGTEHHIQVRAQSYSSVSELASALVSAANKEVGMSDLPDIFSAYSDTALLLNELGVVAHMDAYFTEEELALYQQDFLQEGRFGEDGTLKFIPVAKSTEIVFINETDFQVFAEDTGASLSQMDTWEGLADLAETYYHWTDAQTETPDDGKAFFGVDSEANFMLVAARQLGEELYAIEGESVSFGLSETSAKTIWDNLMVPYMKGYYTAFGNYRSDDVKSGDLIAYAGSTSSVYYFPSVVEMGRAESYEIQGVARTYPYFTGGEKIAIQQGAGMLVSKSDTEREDAATQFLKWFTSPEYNLDFAVATGYIPVQNVALSFDGVMDVMEEMYDEVHPMLVSTAKVVYQEALPQFEFYINAPFEGSYDTRNIVGDSVLDCISHGQETLASQLAEGRNREEILAELVSEEHFQNWYNTLKESVNHVLNP